MTKKLNQTRGVKNVPIVSITLSQLCVLRVGAHLRLHDPESRHLAVKRLGIEPATLRTLVHQATHNDN